MILGKTVYATVRDRKNCERKRTRKA